MRSLDEFLRAIRGRGRVNRRRFLGGAIMASAAMAASRSGVSVVAEDTVPRSTCRTGKWTIAGAELSGGTSDGLVFDGERDGLRLMPGSTDGRYVSAAYRTSFIFNAVGSRWLADLPEGTFLTLEIRVSQDGLLWSEWLGVDSLGLVVAGRGDGTGEIVLAEGQCLQCRATLRREPSGGNPRLQGVTLSYIDSSRGPTRLEAEATARRQFQTMAVGQPPIISRAAWGCPEPNSSVLWPPQYFPTQKLIVHHTVTPNNPPDPAASVRAIYDYHYHLTNQNGSLWGDIGYNFLIDQYGNIYEGRYGGENVAAGHALCYNAGSVGAALLGDFSTVAPAAAAQDALVNLLAWKCSRFRIDPTATAFFIDRTLPNICGHRDGAGGCNNAAGLYTACPGDVLYGMLPTIRSRVAGIVGSLVPGYREVWGAHNTPSIMAPGQTVTVSITVQNKGSLTWTKGNTIGCYRLGYRWYRSNGTQYVQSIDDDKRTDLPNDVLPDQTVTLNAYLTAPREAGNFRLEWDMVREGYTWFSAESCGCNSPLAVNVATIAPTISTDLAKLSFLADDSYVGAPQRVRVDNLGGGWLNWSAISNASWCIVDPSTGASAVGIPSSFSVRVDREIFRSLYGYDQPTTAQVTVSATSPEGAVVNSPRVVSVTFFLSSKPLARSYYPVIRKGA